MRTGEGQGLHVVLSMLAVLLLGAGSAGCREQAPAPGPAAGPGHAASAGPATTPSAEKPVPLLPGTPPGGLRDWVSDIRQSLSGLPTLAVDSPSVAMKRALGAYLSRQEFIERYYEKGQPLAAGDSLDAAVRAAETQFHILLELLGRKPAPDAAEVGRAVGVLEARYDRVLATAESAGARMTPRAAAAPASAGPDGASGNAGATAGAAPGASAAAPGTSAVASGGLDAWLDSVSSGLARVRDEAARAPSAASALALRLYLDDYERIEAYYGPGGPYAAAALSGRVAAGEDQFHGLLRAADSTAVRAAATKLLAQLGEIRVLAHRSGVPLHPRASAAGPAAATTAPATGSTQGQPAAGAAIRSPDLAAAAATLDSAGVVYAAGDVTGALRRVERAYLRHFEPVESRLPAGLVSRMEQLVHLTLRPEMARHAPAVEVDRSLAAVHAELVAADAALSRGASFWFGAFDAFTIIVREGLEAVLLIGAILAYLAAMGAGRRAERQIYAGMAAGVVATAGVWLLARTVVPITGANRELMEGVTALLAVLVLLYVSNWLFQKTYIHDWRDFLRERVGVAATTGSALAMASLAFAAVFREGFETVLFYQALIFDAGTLAVLAGFIPGLLVITGIGWGIIRMGLRLPLKRVFAATNAILLYLAFCFVGKGVYALQESGLFTPHPIAWLPSRPALEQLLGLYPVAETTLAQAAFVALVGLTYLGYRLRARRPAVARASAGEPATPQSADTAPAPRDADSPPAPRVTA